MHLLASTFSMFFSAIFNLAKAVLAVVVSAVENIFALLKTPDWSVNARFCSHVIIPRMLPVIEVMKICAVAKPV